MLFTDDDTRMMNLVSVTHADARTDDDDQYEEGEPSAVGRTFAHGHSDFHVASNAYQAGHASAKPDRQLFLSCHAEDRVCKAAGCRAATGLSDGQECPMHYRKRCLLPRLCTGTCPLIPCGRVHCLQNDVLSIQQRSLGVDVLDALASLEKCTSALKDLQTPQEPRVARRPSSC